MWDNIVQKTWDTRENSWYLQKYLFWTFDNFDSIFVSFLMYNNNWLLNSQINISTSNSDWSPPRGMLFSCLLGYHILHVSSSITGFSSSASLMVPPFPNYLNQVLGLLTHLPSIFILLRCYPASKIQDNLDPDNSQISLSHPELFWTLALNIYLSAHPSFPWADQIGATILACRKLTY